MARPLSDDKREAILDAATRVIAAQGLGAPTATIAREAGVANGSLFTYFPTKADLFNALYLALKTEMATSAQALSTGADTKAALRHAWSAWLAWGHERPDKRRALALLSAADEITPQTHRAGHAVMAPLRELMDASRANGPMRTASIGFVAALMTAAAEATIDTIRSDPEHAARYSKTGFEALWRMIG